MQEHFLKNIEIIDFKCFKNFNAKDFKRVNLISGKNNVGKTAFMESICINLYPDDISTLTNVLLSPKFSREYLEIGFRQITIEEKKDFLESIKNYNSVSNINDVEFNISNKDGIKKYHFRFNKKNIEINSNEFSFDTKKNENIKFLTNLGFTKYGLRKIFESVQKEDKEISLYNFINEFDKNILNFKILGGDKPSCKTSSNEEYQDLNEFGDGLKHYISIICSLYACKNGYLFIDEIDNGIHYTQLEKLWEIILTISKEVNCQVFATTHSKEMINTFANVSSKLEDEDISFIELGRNKENEIKAITMNYERLQRELNIGNELRGW